MSAPHRARRSTSSSAESRARSSLGSVTTPRTNPGPSEHDARRPLLTRANEYAGIIAAVGCWVGIALTLAVALGWVGSSTSPSTTVLACPVGTLVCELNADTPVRG